MEFQKSSFDSQYSLGREIGKGHYATVQFCTNKDTQLNYAAKIIKKKRIATSKIGMSLTDIIQEARILEELDHLNIIKIFDAFDFGNRAVLILELVTGGELFEYIWDRGTLSEEEASKFVRQIVLGVNHMHCKDILHLDLKPENILIEDINTQKIKIIDFGLARKCGSKPILELRGTAEFVAPEIVNYDPLTFATDMWSIGIITIIMLTGFSPFHGDNDNETFSNIMKCDLDLADENCSMLSDIAKSFLSSLIVKEPTSRLSSSDCLNHAWIKPEDSPIQRKRNSFISRDKLSKLKDFVVSPTRPHSMIYSHESLSCNSRLSLPVTSLNLVNISDDELNID